MQLYTRTCVNGENGDDGCDEGESVKVEKCSSTEPCPSWSPWSEYSACSATCGEGERTKTRVCKTSDEIVDGACPGENSQTDVCNKCL